MDKELYLIYVNLIGTNHKGNYLYEFIYSDTTIDIDGEDWDFFPASGRPNVPHKNFIKEVGALESILQLTVVQNSDTFAVWDALDGVIALAWEDIDNYDDYPETRLIFNFGDTKTEVEKKLYERDLTLEEKKETHEK